MDVKVVPASMDEYKALLAADFPELQVEHIRYLGSGWGNAAILVNGAYVFRFPRGLFEKTVPIKSADIKKEVGLLNFLDGKTSFAVPKPEFVAPEQRYFGYKLLPGRLWDQLPANQQFSDELLQSWIRVRCELAKNVPAEAAEKLGVHYYHTDKNIALIQKYLADPGADERVKTMVKDAMDYVLATLKQNDSWVFVHEDLQMSNCFTDEAAQQITGVIDFGDSEIAPIEADFYFWSKWGRPMLDKVAQMQKNYDGTEIDIRLAEAMHQFYIVADYQNFKSRGFTDAAAHKWRQIERYLSG